MDLGLAGKVALVCGGSRGIGFAAANELAGEGARVAICGRDAASLETARTKLVARGTDVLAVTADLSTATGIELVVDAVQTRFDRVDVLITNTGGPPTSPALGADWAAWESATDLLLRSAVELTRAFVPGMQSRKWGRVIGITSMAVKQPVQSLVLSNSLPCRGHWVLQDAGERGLRRRGDGEYRAARVHRDRASQRACRRGNETHRRHARRSIRSVARGHACRAPRHPGRIGRGDCIPGVSASRVCDGAGDLCRRWRGTITSVRLTWHG